MGLDNNDLVAKKVQRVVVTILYLMASMFGLLVLGIWTVLLLNLTGITEWPRPISISTALIVFGISVTVCCAAIWFLHTVRILPLAARTERVISRLLIASILGTIAAAISKAFI